MGMPITVDIPGCQANQVFEQVFALLREIDESFSTYKTDSEVSRYRRGELKKPSRRLSKIIEACQEAEQNTVGYFSAWAAGSFDPSGYVKGWAINEAGKVVQKAGFTTFCIGAGGDILARSDQDKDWSVGIENPLDKQALIGVIKGRNFAVATSGSYERGSHIYTPKTGLPAKELLSFSVTGRNIIEADILATAGFAAGNFGINLVGNRRGYAALAVDRQGNLSMSGGMSRLLHR